MQQRIDITTLGHLKERWLCIDPGLGGTGWAVFHKDRGLPSAWGVIHSPGSKEFLAARCVSVEKKFRMVCEVHRIQMCIFESQGLWASAASMASGFKGDLTKLTFLTGWLSGVAYSMQGQYPHLLEPSMWKGQLPKEIVIKRIDRAFGKKVEIPDHAADAVGIGLAVKGLLHGNG